MFIYCIFWIWLAMSSEAWRKGHGRAVKRRNGKVLWPKRLSQDAQNREP